MGSEEADRRFEEPDRPERAWHQQMLARPVSGSDGLNARIAVWLTRRLGSMWVVYATVAINAAWMVLGAQPVLGFDPYPYPYLLFAGNVVQLLLVFVIMVGQRVLGAAGERRTAQTYQDAQAILVECHRLQNHMQTQDRLLNRASWLLTRGSSQPVRAPLSPEIAPCDTAPIWTPHRARSRPARSRSISGSRPG